MSKLVVLARIAGRQVAIDAAEVLSVIDLKDVVPVPGTSEHVLGVTALRSRPMTVVDSCLAIGEPGVGNPSGVRAIVIDDQDHHYALLVEDVFDVIETQGDEVPVPGNLSQNWQEIGIAMVETGEDPALLIEPTALLSQSSRKAA